MKKEFNIFVEGIADVRFFKQYINHVFGVEVADERLIPLSGWDNLKTETQALRMHSMTANGGVNVVIVDADLNYKTRKDEIEKWKQENEVEFKLFLLPNDKDAGALEDMLENIINPNNRPIMKCWENYEKELVKLDIPGRTPPPLTTPAKKTKIYGYLEALLFDSKSQKEQIKEVNRNYENTQHWNLDAEYLEPLKEFLQKWL
ncbi:MAG: hypothetical protein K5633_06795 [Paludibacteraceae bacterium]|nr:hypothetical protein [Paludibacteraceae bacterium]